MHPKGSLWGAPRHTFPAKFAKVVPCKMHGMHSVFETFSRLWQLPLPTACEQKNILTSWSQLFSAWVVPGSEKYIHWGTKGSPKTPKAVQSDSPGHQKCIQKATLGLYGVPRVPPEVSGALPRRANHKNDIKIQISIKNDG